MRVKINCKYFSNLRCSNKKVKRTLFGARVCSKVGYPPKITCEYQDKLPRPPEPPPKRIHNF